MKWHFIIKVVFFYNNNNIY